MSPRVRGIRKTGSSLYTVRSYAIDQDARFYAPEHVAMLPYREALDAARRSCESEAGIPRNVVEVHDPTRDRVVRRYWETAEEERAPGGRGRVVTVKVRVFRGSISHNMRDPLEVG